MATFYRCVNTKSGGGGEGHVILSGTTTPAQSLGEDENIYLKIGMKGSLLHFDTDLTDASGHTWTSAGTVTVSDEQSKFGGKSLKLSRGDIHSENSSDFTFDSNDFTIAGWIYPTSSSRMSIFATQGTGIAMDIFYNGSSANLWLSSTGSGWGVIQSDGGGANSGIGTITINTNEWTHIAMVRKGNKVRSFVNGALNKEVTIADGVSVFNTTRFNIGVWDNGNHYKYTGYMDEFIILNGVALWETSFTPPRKAYNYVDFAKRVIDAYYKYNNTWSQLIGMDIDNIIPPELPVTREELVVHMGDILDGPGGAKSKQNDEWAIGIWCDNINGQLGYWGPLLVGLTETSVQYNSGQYINTVVVDGVTYYANSGYWQSGSRVKPDVCTLEYSTSDFLTMGLIPQGYTVVDDVVRALVRYYFTPNLNTDFNKLAYLKSDGSAYINTGLKFTSNMYFKVKGRWTDSLSSEEHFFGVWSSGAESNFGVMSSKLFYMIGASGTANSIAMDTISHIIKVTDEDILLDGTSIGTPNWTGVSNAYRVPIFARSVNGTISNITSHFALEYFKIWYDTQLIKDFIPVERKSDNVLGLYDKVNKTFYQNDGSGNFSTTPKLKTYAKFTNGTGFKLPYKVNSDYKITVIFNQTVFTQDEPILDTAYNSPYYVRLVTYNNLYWSSSGTSQNGWGSWSAGEHTFVNNVNSKNIFDGNEVQNYTPTDANYYLTIGKVSETAARQITSNTYYKLFKIESISTGDVICELKPAMDGTTACFYDTVNDTIYTANGLVVSDDIS